MADSEPARIYSTSEVANHLGISANTVRRYGLAWEEVQGETLPHLPGMGRLYPADVVEVLEQAHAWLDDHSGEIEEALQQVLGLSGKEKAQTAAPPEAFSTSLREAVSQAIAPLAHEVERMQAQLTRLEEGQRALLAQLAELQLTPADPELGTPLEVAQPEPQGPAPLEDLPPNLVVETRPEANVGTVRNLQVQVEDVPFRPAAPDWAFFKSIATPDPKTEQRTEPKPERRPAPKPARPTGGDPLADVWLEDEPSEEEVVLEEPGAAERAAITPEGAKDSKRRDAAKDADKDNAGFIGWFKRNF